MFQLEDDIVTKPGYLSTMKSFALNQKTDDWMLLEFSHLGFIGKSTQLVYKYPISCITVNGVITSGVELQSALWIIFMLFTAKNQLNEGGVEIRHNRQNCQ